MAGVQGNDKFCLKWNDFENNVSTAFQELREDRDFFDVTLACEGNQLEAHKVILSACSPFFRGVLKRNPHNHPLLYLRGIKYESILAVLNFMYNGEVNIAQAELSSFLAVAEDLQVKGLTKATSSTSSPPIKRPPTQNSSPQPSARPPAKLRRPASPTPYETPSLREREGDHVVIGLDGGLPGIKTEHQEATPLEGGREVATTEYAAEEMPEQFGMPPDLHYQEEMAQALAEGTVGPYERQKDRNLAFETYVTKEQLPGLPIMFRCTLCGKSMAQKRNALNHVENIHFPGSFIHQCSSCGKELKSKEALNNHVRTHKDV